MSRLLLIACLLFACLLGSAEMALSEGTLPLKNRDRVLFLGDSITNAGMYVQYVDAYLSTRFPDRQFELINLGLPSETVTGLSEPDHPYPRPDLHERLQRALTKVKPDVVVLCYGMNDGIYYPFSELRFRQYREAYQDVLAQVRKTGARVVLMTPPPFDPLPVQSVVRPAGQFKYSWVNPYSDYDDVLTRYSEWLLGFRKQGIPVADVHSAESRFLAAVRKEDPGYFVAKDGVHPNETGEWLMAQELLRTLSMPAEVDAAVIDARHRRAHRGEVTGIRASGPSLTFDWRSRVPMPLDPAWHPRLDALAGITESLDRYRLTVTGLARPRYLLLEGQERLGEVTREELAAGVDLLKFPALTTNRHAAELLPAVRQRERLLAPAWLTYVGHKRPGTAAGLPLDEAREKAIPLTDRIRELAQPVTLHLTITAE